jgi:hypothetical protein
MPFGTRRAENPGGGTGTGCEPGEGDSPKPGGAVACIGVGPTVDAPMILLKKVPVRADSPGRFLFRLKSSLGGEFEDDSAPSLSGLVCTLSPVGVMLPAQPLLKGSCGADIRCGPIRPPAEFVPIPPNELSGGGCRSYSIEQLT